MHHFIMLLWFLASIKTLNLQTRTLTRVIPMKHSPAPDTSTNRQKHHESVVIRIQSMLVPQHKEDANAVNCLAASGNADTCQLNKQRVTSFRS